MTTWSSRVKPLPRTHAKHESLQRLPLMSRCAGLRPHQVRFLDVPFRAQLPELASDHVAEDEKSTLEDLEFGGIGAEFHAVGRAVRAETAVLRFVLLRVCDEQLAMFFGREVVGRVFVFRRELRIAAHRFAHREVRHRVVAEQHQVFAAVGLDGCVAHAAPR